MSRKRILRRVPTFVFSFFQLRLPKKTAGPEGARKPGPAARLGQRGIREGQLARGELPRDGAERPDVRGLTFPTKVCTT